MEVREGNKMEMDIEELHAALEDLQTRKSDLAKAELALAKAELFFAFCERMKREHNVESLKDLPPSVRETIEKLVPTVRPDVDLEEAVEALFERHYPGTPGEPN